LGRLVRLDEEIETRSTEYEADALRPVDTQYTHVFVATGLFGAAISSPPLSSQTFSSPIFSRQPLKKLFEIGSVLNSSKKRYFFDLKLVRPM